jgi:hypothetical protein
MNSKAEDIFIYIAYGRKFFKRIAKLSITSLKNLGVRDENILVLTDDQLYFKNSRVNFLNHSNAEITNWMGPLNYPLRLKIKTCIQVRKQYPGRRIVFSDADTFWTQLPPEDVSLAFLHCDEPWTNEASLVGYHAIAESMRLKRSGMFNSGLIGLPETVDDQILNTVLELADQICMRLTSKMYLAEQYAFSCVISSLPNFTTAQDCALHYWNCSSEIESLTQHLSDSELASLSQDDLKKLINQSLELQNTFANKFRRRFSKLKRSFRKRLTEAKALFIRQKTEG